ARRRAGHVGSTHTLERIGPTELASQLPPEGPHLDGAVHPGLARWMEIAVEHGNAGTREIEEPGLLQHARNTGQLAQRALARGEVIDGEHAMRLAAAERRLELNDGLAAASVQALGHLGQEQPQALGDEGALEEDPGV